MLPTAVCVRSTHSSSSSPSPEQIVIELVPGQVLLTVTIVYFVDPRCLSATNGPRNSARGFFDFSVALDPAIRADDLKFISAFGPVAGFDQQPVRSFNARNESPTPFSATWERFRRVGASAASLQRYAFGESTLRKSLAEQHSGASYQPPRSGAPRSPNEIWMRAGASRFTNSATRVDRVGSVLERLSEEIVRVRVA